MSIYDKKLYIKKADGTIQTANLYTDKSDVGDNYLTFKYNGNTVYAVLSSNGDIDFNVSYNHSLYKIKSNVIVWKTDEYRMFNLYPSAYQTMTELPNDRDWIEFVRYRKDLNSMFINCSNLITVPLFDTSNVTNMLYMFNCCLNLTTVPLFDTSKVKDMNSMFNKCEKLTTVPLFDTSNVINMYCMFFVCLNLTTIPLFDTSHVTNMMSMFAYCKKLISVSKFDTSNVTNMKYMFYKCNSLTELPIFDIRNVTNIQNMILETNITKITFKNKPPYLAVTPEILGKPDVQITFI